MLPSALKPLYGHTTNLTFHLLPQMELNVQVGGDSHHLSFY